MTHKVKLVEQFMLQATNEAPYVYSYFCQNFAITFEKLAALKSSIWHVLALIFFMSKTTVCDSIGLDSTLAEYGNYTFLGLCLASGVQEVVFATPFTVSFESYSVESKRLVRSSTYLSCFPTE